VRARIGALLGSLDRRIVYVLIVVSVAVPLIRNMSLPPAQMRSAEKIFEAVRALDPAESKMVLVSADWSPGTSAENQPQTEVVLEHLLRRRIKFALLSQDPFSLPFLERMPKEIVERLEKEMPGEKWAYGTDWVNLGFRPGGRIMVTRLAQAEDLSQELRSDATGTSLAELPAFRSIRSIRDIAMVVQVTGSVGLLDPWIQFFQVEGHRPQLAHGCTSVTVAEAFNYLISGQLVGLFEGIAGAAWYEHLLTQSYPNRIAGKSVLINTSLAVGHLVILLLIVLGNVSALITQTPRGAQAQ
jgi:hypothetical protein